MSTRGPVEASLRPPSQYYMHCVESILHLNRVESRTSVMHEICIVHLFHIDDVILPLGKLKLEGGGGGVR